MYELEMAVKMITCNYTIMELDIIHEPNYSIWVFFQVFKGLCEFDSKTIAVIEITYSIAQTHGGHGGKKGWGSLWYRVLKKKHNRGCVSFTSHLRSFEKIWHGSVCELTSASLLFPGTTPPSLTSNIHLHRVVWFPWLPTRKRRCCIISASLQSSHVSPCVLMYNFILLHPWKHTFPHSSRHSTNHLNKYSCF